MGLMVANEPGRIADAEHFTRYVCGAEVNYSIGLARLGHEVAYVTRVGKDPFGEHIYDFLQENKILTDYVHFDDTFLTGMQLKECAVDGKDPVVVNFRKGTAFSHFDRNDLSAISWEGVKLLHATGIPPALSATCDASIEEMMTTAHEKGVYVSFDPNLRPALWPSEEAMRTRLNELAFKADLVLPGQKEGLILTGSDDPTAIADFYLKEGVKAVIVKLGAKGAYIKTSDGFEAHTPAFKVEEVVDTVGAGDGFAVGVTSALLEGLSLPEAARRGAAIGALAVMVQGDNEGLPTREKLTDFMEGK